MGVSHADASLVAVIILLGTAAVLPRAWRRSVLIATGVVLGAAYLGLAIRIWTLLSER